MSTPTEAQTLGRIEVLQRTPRSIPFIHTALALARFEGISIPHVDVPFLGREHAATEKYLFAQTERQNTSDTSGVMWRLVGFADTPSEAAVYAKLSAQKALETLEATVGKKAKNEALSVLFEDKDPQNITLSDLINLDWAWGETVNGLKFARNGLNLGLRAKGIQMLNTLVQQESHIGLAGLTQRQPIYGGINCDGCLADITESLKLPVIAMPEVDAIVPDSLRHGYPVVKENQPDAIRFVRRGGVLGNDIFRAVLNSIVATQQTQPLGNHQSSMP
jgi:hypothetical protein